MIFQLGPWAGELVWEDEGGAKEGRLPNLTPCFNHSDLDCLGATLSMWSHWKQGFHSGAELENHCPRERPDAGLQQDCMVYSHWSRRKVLRSLGATVAAL